MLADGSIVSFSMVGSMLRFWEKIDEEYIITQEFNPQDKKITSFTVISVNAIAVGFDDGSIQILNK